MGGHWGVPMPDGIRHVWARPMLRIRHVCARPMLRIRARGTEGIDDALSSLDSAPSGR